MKLSLAFAAVTLLVSLGTRAGEMTFTAKTYDSKSNKQTLLFTQKNEVEDKGDLRVYTSTYLDASGATLAVEAAEFSKAGTKAGAGEVLRAYRISDKQQGIDSSLEVIDGEARFQHISEGKTKTGMEKIGSDFVVGPSLVPLIKANWEGLMNGGKVKIRFAVIDRQETVGFELSKAGEGTIDGQKTVDIKMKPSSFLIAALVDPLHFHMSADGQKLVEYVGRVLVKRKEGSKWKDLDAVTVYQYPTSGGNTK